MLKDIVRFEWRYHTRQASFPAAIAVFLFFGATMTATGFGPSNININSPYAIAQSIGFLSLISVFILAVFCANAVVRDRDTQMEEIVYTTSVGKLPFLTGRFVGSFLAAFTAFSASIVGLIGATFLPSLDADRLGPLQLGHYLWPLLIIALPNMLFAAAVLFALSTITRNVLASYAGSVLLYVLYFVASALTNSPLMASSVPGAQENAWLAAVLDPFALSAFFEQTRNWEPQLRNTQLISLTGNFLLNRLLWIGASIAIVAAVYRVFAFRVISGRAKGKRIVETPTPTIANTSPVSVAHVTPSDWRSYLAATKIELRSFLFTLPFLAIVLLWIGLIGSELFTDVTSGEYGSARFPVPGLLFASLSQPLALITTILLVYISGELVWRERALRFSGILNASPASNLVFVGSKCTVLAIMVGVITASGLAALAGVQLLRGWPVEPLLLLQFAYFLATPLVIVALIAIFIQTLSPHKYLGMLIVLVVLLVGMFGPALGLQHPLIRFGNAPEVAYSDMNGFGRPERFHWYVLYCSAFAGLLISCAVVLWRHGARAYRRLLPIRKPAIALLAILIGSGAFIFYNTNVLAEYRTSNDVSAWRADYERRYKALANQATPRIAAVQGTVDLEPESRDYRVRGQYTLVNESSSPISTYSLTVRREASPAIVTSRDAVRVDRDARFNQYTVVLREPLQPGARTAVQFDLHYQQAGFVDEDAEQTIVENGSFLMNHRSFPSMGYRTSYEIEDARERQKQGLPPRRASEEAREYLLHSELAFGEWVDFDLTVSTAADQTAIAPGKLVRSWKERGRSFVHYRSDAPIPNQFAIGSGRYAVTREKHHGVEIEIYHHAAHAQNVARIMRAAAESLRYCIDQFGPYPQDHLRIVEVPSVFTRFAGFAEPGLIFLGETRGFLTDARNAEHLDLVYRRVAHEVAHQWWGHNLIAKPGPGATVIVETLTKYVETMALEKAYGREQVRRLLTYELDLYLSGRTGQFGAEPPLAKSDRQSYLYYRKGALVMYALKDLLSEANVNLALRNLLRERGGANGDATTVDLLRHLNAVATPEQRVAIHRWMNEVVLYDFRMASAQSRKLPDGRYEVQLVIDADMPAPEEIEIGVFDADSAPLHLAKNRLHKGTQNLTFIVDREPESAAVDPYILRIDSNRFDNLTEISPRR